jgi:peptidyl-prolyl cis-trans isomerase C
MTQFSRARWTRLSAAASVAFLLVACNKAPPTAAATPEKADAPAANAVATVDSSSISPGELAAYQQDLMRGRQQQTELTPEQKAQTLDQLISMQVLANQAVKEGSDKEPDVAAQLAIQRVRVLADGEAQKYLKGKEPTDAEIKAEYDSQVAALDKTEYKARHILVDSKEKAQAVIKKIKGGAKFEDVAKAESSDNSKASGGDLGWFNLQRMVPPFSAAVKGLKKGEMTQEPVQTQFGWHVIRLDDTRDSPPPPFEQVKAQVANSLMQKKLIAYVDGLKKDAKIEKKM